MNPITVDAKAFTKELEWCARFVERKTTIPILSNIMLKKAGDLLHFTATDLEVGAITSIEADGPDFELTVPVHLLLKYLKKVDDKALSLVPKITYDARPEGPHVKGCDGNGTKKCCEPPTVHACALAVQHGTEDDGVSIDGMPISSYPELPTAPQECVEIGGLETAIPRACLAISSETSRFTLNGALLAIKDKSVQFVATDGHRLSIAEAKLHDVSRPYKAVIPKMALTELVRLGDSAYLAHNDNHVFFTVAQRTIISRKLTGNFPDWERVVPKELKYVVTVPSAGLKKVLDRVSVFADERSRAVEVSINGSLSVAARTYETRAKGQVAIAGPTFAYPYVAGFNANYFTDFLKTADTPEFYFRFHKCAEAVECDVQGWRYVLMPMRSDDNSDPVVEGECSPVPFVIEAMDRKAAEDTPAVEVQPVPVNDTGDRIDAPVVARLLKINHATVYNWVKRGKLPEPVKVGRAMTWTRSQIEAMVA